MTVGAALVFVSRGGRARGRVVFTRGQGAVIHLPRLVRAGSSTCHSASIFTFLFRTQARQVLDNMKRHTLQLFTVYDY